MKYYVFILMSLLLVCCYNKPETQEQKVNIVQEFKRTNKLCISIEYKQPVNGYTVKVICSPYDCYDKERDTEIWGKALLCFEKDNRCFYIYNDSYSDSLLFYENKTPIKDGMVLYLDYLPKRADEYLSENSPFFFHDIDFDGKEELIINNWREGIRYCNIYDVYKVDESGFRQITDPPFYKISNYATEFDPINQTITLNDPIEAGVYLQHIYKRFLHEEIDSLSNKVDSCYKFELVKTCRKVFS